MDLLDFRILASLRDILSERHFIYCHASSGAETFFLNRQEEGESPHKAQAPISGKDHMYLFKILQDAAADNED